MEPYTNTEYMHFDLCVPTQSSISMELRSLSETHTYKTISIMTCTIRQSTTDQYLRKRPLSSRLSARYSQWWAHFRNPLKGCILFLLARDHKGACGYHGLQARCLHDSPSCCLRCLPYGPSCSLQRYYPESYNLCG